LFFRCNIGFVMRCFFAQKISIKTLKGELFQVEAQESDKVFSI
jgi:hypothetical protein